MQLILKVINYEDEKHFTEFQQSTELLQPQTKLKAALFKKIISCAPATFTKYCLYNLSLCEEE